jgi:hypothetical protein
MRQCERRLGGGKGGSNLGVGGGIVVSGEEVLKSRLLRDSGGFDAGNPVRWIAAAAVELEERHGFRSLEGRRSRMAMV